jgi:hypothetical protein
MIESYEINAVKNKNIGLELCLESKQTTVKSVIPGSKILLYTFLEHFTSRFSQKNKIKMFIVRCGVRTHALSRVPELKSGALDHSANLTISY